MTEVEQAWAQIDSEGTLLFIDMTQCRSHAERFLREGAPSEDFSGAVAALVIAVLKAKTEECAKLLEANGFPWAAPLIRQHELGDESEIQTPEKGNDE